MKTLITSILLKNLDYFGRYVQIHKILLIGNVSKLKEFLIISSWFSHTYKFYDPLILYEVALYYIKL